MKYDEAIEKIENGWKLRHTYNVFEGDKYFLYDSKTKEKIGLNNKVLTKIFKENKATYKIKRPG